MSYKIIISHPRGNQNVRGVIDALKKNNILDSYHTCIACIKYNLFYFISFLYPPIKRRSYNTSIYPHTHLYPIKELLRMICNLLGITSLTRHELGMFCNDQVAHYLDKKVAKYIKKSNSIHAIYAYEDNALESFIAAKKNNILCLYDLPTIYWRYKKNIYDNEIINNPAWSNTFKIQKESTEKLERKDKELELADVIFVATSYTKKTLELFPKKLNHIKIIPYGFPPINKDRKYIPFKGRKIKALFVGGLSQGKGLSYLFESIKNLEKHIELTVIGQGNIKDCPLLKQALKKHTYIPSLPHDEILNCMAQHDLLIFPSLFEGFGLVITEAMSQGTPVITTERTCGPDFIINGENGWIVEAGQSENIHHLLINIIKEPEILHKTGKAAMQTAANRPWKLYEEDLINSIKVINETNHI